VRTPPLRRRVTEVALGVMTGLLVLVSALVFVIVRAGLEESLNEVLQTRADLAVDTLEVRDPAEAAAHLTTLGIPAVIESGGEVFVADPASPHIGGGVPGPLTSPIPRESVTVRVDAETTVEVFASRAGIQSALRRLLVALVGATAVAIALAYLLLRRVVDGTMSPLEEIAATAERIAEGGTGERLEPDQPETELGRMAESFDHMVVALEAAVARAEDEQERTHRFLSDAAHQLRTPVSGIRLAVEQLLKEEDAEMRDRLLAHTVRETARAGRLVTSLLHVARLDQGRPPTRVPTDLAELCADEVARAGNLAPHLDVRLDVRAAPEGPVPLDTDEIREAIANLVDNARRHARSVVEVGVAAVDGMAEVRVSDDGPGLREGAERLVFERFATLDGKGGSGLGLPIARGVARAHGGDVVHDKGVFTLRIPLETVQADVSGDLLDSSA
jgi:two-component system, OmpR family, sensor kinase